MIWPTNKTTFLVIGCRASLIVISNIWILCFNSSRPSSQQRRNAGKEVRCSVEKRAKLSSKDLEFDRFLIITIQDGALPLFGSLNHGPYWHKLKTQENIFEIWSYNSS